MVLGRLEIEQRPLQDRADGPPRIERAEEFLMNELDVAAEPLQRLAAEHGQV
jgi:hypothetical protein